MNTHLINSRSTILFDILASENETFLDSLRDFDKIMKEKLKAENIQYKKLRTTLSPGNKGDIAFIFDWTKIESPLYGEYVLNLLMPKLDKSDFCFLHGDYSILSANLLEKQMRIELLKEALDTKYDSFSDPSSYYIVYFSNIGIDTAKIIDDDLKDKEISYVGFADLNLNSFFKTVLSFTLVQSFVKYNHTILESSCDTKYIEKNTCPNFIGLKNYNYRFFNVNSNYYDVFLTYRISSNLYQNDNNLYYSLKYLDPEIYPKFLEEFKIVITDEKILYALEKKSYIFEKWGLHDTKEIRDFLMKKIKDSLLIEEVYDLEFMNEHNTFKFNIYIEHMNRKYRIGLRILIDRKELFFITLSSIDK